MNSKPTNKTPRNNEAWKQKTKVERRNHFSESARKFRSELREIATKSQTQFPKALLWDETDTPDAWIDRFAEMIRERQFAPFSFERLNYSYPELLRKFRPPEAKNIRPNASCSGILVDRAALPKLKLQPKAIGGFYDSRDDFFSYFSGLTRTRYWYRHILGAQTFSEYLMFWIDNMSYLEEQYTPFDRAMLLTSLNSRNPTYPEWAEFYINQTLLTFGGVNDTPIRFPDNHKCARPGRNWQAKTDAERNERQYRMYKLADQPGKTQIAAYKRELKENPQFAEFIEDVKYQIALRTRLMQIFRFKYDPVGLYNYIPFLCYVFATNGVGQSYSSVEDAGSPALTSPLHTTITDKRPLPKEINEATKEVNPPNPNYSRAEDLIGNGAYGPAQAILTLCEGFDVEGPTPVDEVRSLIEATVTDRGIEWNEERINYITEAMGWQADRMPGTDFYTTYEVPPQRNLNVEPSALDEPPASIELIPTTPPEQIEEREAELNPSLWSKICNYTASWFKSNPVSDLSDVAATARELDVNAINESIAAINDIAKTPEDREKIKAVLDLLSDPVFMENVKNIGKTAETINNDGLFGFLKGGILDSFKEQLGKYTLFGQMDGFLDRVDWGRIFMAYIMYIRCPAGDTAGQVASMMYGVTGVRSLNFIQIVMATVGLWAAHYGATHLGVIKSDSGDGAMASLWETIKGVGLKTGVIATLLVVVAGTFGVFLSPSDRVDTWNLARSIRDIGFAAQATNHFVMLGKNLMTMYDSVAAWLYQKWTGKQFSAIDDDTITRAEDFETLAGMYDSDGMIPVLTAQETHRDNMQTLLDNITVFRTELWRRGDSNYNQVAARMSQCITRLRDKLSKVRGLAQKTPVDRSVPFVMCLYGVPGCEKTTIATELATRRAMMWGDSVYAHNPISAYWDGYNGQRVILMDDFNCVDKQEDAELLHLVSCAPYATVQADICDKGRPCRAQMIYMTTNNERFRATGVFHKGAIERRRHWMIRVEPHPDVLVDGEQEKVVDPAKVGNWVASWAEKAYDEFVNKNILPQHMSSTLLHRKSPEEIKKAFVAHCKAEKLYLTFRTVNPVNPNEEFEPTRWLHTAVVHYAGLDFDNPISYRQLMQLEEIVYQSFKANTQEQTGIDYLNQEKHDLKIFLEIINSACKEVNNYNADILKTVQNEVALMEERYNKINSFPTNDCLDAIPVIKPVDWLNQVKRNTESLRTQHEVPKVTVHDRGHWMKKNMLEVNSSAGDDDEPPERPAPPVPHEGERYEAVPYHGMTLSLTYGARSEVGVRIFPRDPVHEGRDVQPVAVPYQIAARAGFSASSSEYFAMDVDVEFLRHIAVLANNDETRVMWHGKGSLAFPKVRNTRWFTRSTSTFFSLPAHIQLELAEYINTVPEFQVNTPGWVTRLYHKVRSVYRDIRRTMTTPFWHMWRASESFRIMIETVALMSVAVLMILAVGFLVDLLTPPLVQTTSGIYVTKHGGKVPSARSARAGHAVMASACDDIPVTRIAAPKSSQFLGSAYVVDFGTQEKKLKERDPTVRNRIKLNTRCLRAPTYPDSPRFTKFIGTFICGNAMLVPRHALDKVEMWGAVELCDQQGFWTRYEVDPQTDIWQSSDTDLAIIVLRDHVALKSLLRYIPDPLTPAIQNAGFYGLEIVEPTNPIDSVHPPGTTIHMYDPQQNPLLISNEFRIDGAEVHDSFCFRMQWHQGGSGSAVLLRDGRFSNCPLIGMMNFMFTERVGYAGFTALRKDVLTQAIEDLKVTTWSPSKYDLPGHVTATALDPETITDINCYDGYLVPAAYEVMHGKHAAPSATKQDFVKSPIYDDVVDLYPSGKQPSIVSPVDPRWPKISAEHNLTHHLQMSALKNVRDFCPLWPRYEMDLCAQMVGSDLKKTLRFDMSPAKIWDIRTSITGVAAGRMDPHSAAGFPIQHEHPNFPGKSWCYTIDDNGKVSFIQPEFEQRCKEMLKELRQNRLPPAVHKIFPKAELRAKLEKTRSIAIVDAVTTCVCRMLFGDFCERLTLHGRSTAFAPGINPTSIEWREIFDELFSKSNGKACWDSDVQNWDGHFNVQIAIAVARVANMCYGHDYWCNCPDCVARIAMCIYLFSAPFQIDRIVYQTTRGNPSGSPLTTVKNTVGHMIEAYAQYREIMQLFISGELLPDPKLIKILTDKGIAVPTKRDLIRARSYSEYKRNVATRIYGDDKITSVALEMLPFYNAATEADAYRRGGKGVTSADKSDTTITHTSIYKIQFLKRTFKWCKDTGRMCAPLDKPVLFDMLRWVRAPDGVRAIDQLYLTMYAGLREAVQHGEEFFEYYQNVFTDALASLGFPTERQSYMDYVIDESSAYHDEETWIPVKQYNPTR